MRRFLKINVLSFVLLVSCANTNEVQNSTNKEFQAYWYNNEAEISSYTLSQARYGELHQGEAVLIFVTEPFSKKTYTKADQSSASDIPVLKMNFTKKFNTGVYPYSMMTSAFTPVNGNEHTLKISSSSQEWCGHTYMQLVNKGRFQIKSFSYFQAEAEQEFSLAETHLEDELWTKIRLGGNLPSGNLKVIPAFFYLRLMHKEIKPYECTVTKTDSSLSFTYPELNRSLKIKFQKEFPYKILAWEETYESGWGEAKKILTTKAVLNKTLKSPYWEKHHNVDADLRKELGLE